MGGGGHLVTDWSRMLVSNPVVLIEDTEDEFDLSPPSVYGLIQGCAGMI